MRLTIEDASTIVRIQYVSGSPMALLSRNCRQSVAYASAYVARGEIESFFDTPPALNGIPIPASQQPIPGPRSTIGQSRPRWRQCGGQDKIVLGQLCWAGSKSAGFSLAVGSCWRRPSAMPSPKPLRAPEPSRHERPHPCQQCAEWSARSVRWNGF